MLRFVKRASWPRELDESMCEWDDNELCLYSCGSLRRDLTMERFTSSVYHHVLRHVSKIPAVQYVTAELVHTTR